MIYVLILIRSGVKSKVASGTTEENLKSEQNDSLIRVFTSYQQMMGILSEFDLYNFPVFPTILAPVTFVGTSYRSMININCFLSEAFPLPLTFFKAMLNLLVPVALLAVIAGLLFVRFCICKRQEISQFKKLLAISAIVVVYIYHPNITNSTFQLLICKELDPGSFWLVEDYDIQCYTPQWYFFALAFVLPSVVLIVFGVPTFMFCLLRSNRHKLDEVDVRAKYGFLLTGIQPQRYYWENLITLKKIIIITANSMLYLQPTVYKSLVTLLVLAIYFQVQDRMQPYKDPQV